MKLSLRARRLGVLGAALSVTLVSASWLFFGTRAEDAALAAPAKATPATVAAAKAAPAGVVVATASAPVRIASTAAAQRTTVAPTGARTAVDSAPTVITIEREVFAYTRDGRRDPFRALISTSVIRPLPSELRLVAVVFDPRGVGSVAILRDLTTKSQHRVRAGQLLGRMRVAQIRKKDVVFTIEELGFSRQEILGLQDSTATRLP